MAFVIGLFLGWVTWRAGSVRPAMLAHAANNTVWVFATRARLGVGLPRLTHAALLAAYAVTVILSVRCLVRAREDAATSPGALA